MTPRTIKLTILSIILAPATFYLAYIFSQLETNPEVSFLITKNAVRFLIQFVVAFGAFTILTGVLAATNLRPIIQFIASAVQGLIFWIGLFLTNSGLNGSGQMLKDAALSFLLTLGIFYFIAVVTNDQKLLIKFSLRRVYPRNIRALLIIITLLLSANFYLSYSDVIKNEGFEIPPAVFESITDPIINMVEKNLSGQIEGLWGEEMKEIGIEEQEEMTKFMLEEFEETLGEGEGRQKFGFTPEMFNLSEVMLPPQGELDLKPSLKNVGPAIQKRIQEAIKPYEEFVAPAITLMLFLSLQLIDVLIAGIALVVLAVIFKVLVLFNFARLEKRTEEVERLIFE